MVMWRETAAQLQQLLADADKVNCKVVAKALDVAVCMGGSLDLKSGDGRRLTPIACVSFAR